MPEIKFGADNGSAPAPVVEETKVVNTPVAGVTVETKNTSCGVPATTGNSAFGLKDRLLGFRDVILPRLNIVFQMSAIANQFPVGSIVFGKETLLYTPPVIDAAQGVITKAASPAVNIYVLGIVSERFSEKIEGQVGGEVVDTEDQVRALGGTLDYDEWKMKRGEGMRRFEPLVELLLAIEKPAQVDDPAGAVFGFPVGDKKFTIGFWSCKGSTYTEAVKSCFNRHRVMGLLQKGYFTHGFGLTTKSKSFKTATGQFAAPIPVCTPHKEPSSEAVLEFVGKVLNPMS
jgi:hypothetical protein